VSEKANTLFASQTVPFRNPKHSAFNILVLLGSSILIIQLLEQGHGSDSSLSPVLKMFAAMTPLLARNN